MSFTFDLLLSLRGKDFPVKDSWIQGGKADPYLVFYKSREATSLVVPKSGEYMGEVDEKVYQCIFDGKKQFQKNTLDPIWPELSLPARDLCDGGKLNFPFLINIWDYDLECPNDDFMGFCVVSILDLIKANLLKEGIPLQPGKAGHKWGGFLFVDEIKIFEKDKSPGANSFLHILAEGGDIQSVLLLLDWKADVSALNEVFS
jgi:hypothetical protein